MIGRRSFLAALAAAPAALKEVAAQAGSGASTIANVMAADPSGMSDVAEVPAHISEARKHLQKIHERENRRLWVPDRYSQAIANKRSWSPAFKHHQHMIEAEKLSEIQDVWGMSSTELVSMALKYGWTGLNK